MTKSKATPARRLALALVRTARQREAYMRELIDTERTKSELDSAEFNFAQVLAFGVVMCRGVLDEFINANLNSPRDIKPKVRDALCITAYEMLFLKKPEHVVTNQGVELVRLIAPKAVGLANAVIRKMCKTAHEFMNDETIGSVALVARQAGMQEWLTQMIVEQYGIEQAQDILDACLQPAPTYLTSYINPQGKIYEFACDASAQSVAQLVPVDGVILEIGAGRGTKTLQLLEAGARSIHTLDVHEFKCALLEQRLKEAGVPDDMVVTHTGDGRNLDDIEGLPEQFDVVFIDAPCSGTGTLRRHPEIRWRLTPDDVAQLAQLQKEMLHAAQAKVKPGGTLVYATCSILTQENQDVIAVLNQKPEQIFSSVPQSQGSDGHFAAVFKL